MAASKIRWDSNERDFLSTKVAEAVYLNPELDLIRALREAQKSLPANRRRKLSTISIIQLKWLELLVNSRLLELEKEAREIAERKEKEREREMEPLQSIENATMEELFHEILKRAVPMLARELAPIVRDAVFEARAYDKSDFVKPAEKVRLKKVLIIGLLPKQANEIDRSFNDVLDIKFLSGANQAQIKNAAAGADAIFAHTDHMNHSAEAAARSTAKKYIRVSGGLTSLKDAIENYYLESSEL